MLSQNKQTAEVMALEVAVAARVITQPGPQRPLIRFTANQAGGSALVPLLPQEADGRCSPDFDPAPFQAAKGQEVWANFEFVNIDENDRDLLVLSSRPTSTDTRTVFVWLTTLAVAGWAARSRCLP